MAGEARPENEPWRDELGQEIEPDACFQNRAGQKMKPPAQRTGQRLRLEMIVERRPVAPHFITADLDQSGAKHNPESQPAEQSDHRHRGRLFGKRTRVQQRTEKDGEESGFKELDLPSVAVPVLPNVNEGHVEKPEDSEQWRIRETCQHHAGKHESDPRHRQKACIGMNEPEERWQMNETGG